MTTTQTPDWEGFLAAQAAQTTARMTPKPTVRKINVYLGIGDQRWHAAAQGRQMVYNFVLKAQNRDDATVEAAGLFNVLGPVAS